MKPSLRRTAPIERPTKFRGTPGPIARFCVRLGAILWHPLNGKRRSQFRNDRLSRRRGAPQALRPPPQAILDQIRRQAWHEPAALAPGVEALPRLPQVEAADLSTRDEVDVNRLFAAIGVRPETVLVVPRLDDGDPASYSADLLEALLSAGAGPALLVVTHQTSSEASGGPQFARLARLRAATSLFWPDYCGPTGVQSAVMFGRFLNALRASRVIVVDSRIGLEAVSIFGLRLSHTAKLYCAYFALNPSHFLSGFGAWFPRKTGPFAMSISASETMAKSLRRLFGSQPGPGVAVLPPRLSGASESVFVSRLNARLARMTRHGVGRSWLWISPIAAGAGAAVLGRLARQRRGRRFDLYGPPLENLERLGLYLPNIRYLGATPDLQHSDLTDYQGFVFTSPCEALPNIVLEMSQQAIPIVVSDAEALRETFGDALVFVRQDDDAAETAARFASALDRVEAEDAETIAARIRTARERAMMRHSPSVHARAVATTFGLASSDAA